MKRIISRILISAGIIIIGIAVFIEASTIYNQKKLIDEYSKYAETLKNMEISELTAEAAVVEESDINKEVNTDEQPITEQPEQEETESPEQNNKAPEEAPKNTAPDLTEIFKNKQISGLIEIPKIKVSAAILEGTDDSALQYAVGHYPGFGEIGQAGNYVLLGHRNYVYGHFFRNIDKLEADDQIIITKGNNVYTYSVTESFVVKPEEVWVLEQTEDATITLITCTPIGTYTDRLIVKGVLLNND
ncbi:MAG TPA: class D sortase [Sedimentibacter sp.]|nr:class D sortase [Sedimentibacter sp.]